jgi:hypothetical protein
VGRAGAECDGDAACEDGTAGEDPAWLAMGEGDVPGLALVIPTLQAARDRPATQVITAMAVWRYVLIRCLSPGSLVAVTSRLGGHLAEDVVALSQFCDIWRGFGTAQHLKAGAGYRTLTRPRGYI